MLTFRLVVHQHHLSAEGKRLISVAAAQLSRRQRRRKFPRPRVHQKLGTLLLLEVVLFCWVLIEFEC